MAHAKAKVILLINIHNLALEDHCQKTQNKTKNKETKKKLN